MKCNFTTLFFHFQGYFSPWGQLFRTHGLTDVFAISKLKLPERSNGKMSPCNITYHRDKMEIIDLTGLNINNEWFKTPLSVLALCILRNRREKREKNLGKKRIFIRSFRQSCRRVVSSWRNKTKSCCDFNVLVWGCGGALMRWERVVSR